MVKLYEATLEQLVMELSNRIGVKEFNSEESKEVILVIDRQIVKGEQVSNEN